MKIQNPVLPGFHPDPSLLRVGNDYYIATSTFEWFPGVCICHSKDLANWKIVSYALTDDRKCDLVFFSVFIEKLPDEKRVRMDIVAVRRTQHQNNHVRHEFSGFFLCHFFG